jgi:hypothetical protein
VIPGHYRNHVPGLDTPREWHGTNTFPDQRGLSWPVSAIGTKPGRDGVPAPIFYLFGFPEHCRLSGGDVRDLPRRPSLAHARRHAGRSWFRRRRTRSGCVASIRSAPDSDPVDVAAPAQPVYPRQPGTPVLRHRTFLLEDSPDRPVFPSHRVRSGHTRLLMAQILDRRSPPRRPAPVGSLHAGRARFAGEMQTAASIPCI